MYTVVSFIVPTLLLLIAVVVFFKVVDNFCLYDEMKYSMYSFVLLLDFKISFSPVLYSILNLRLSYEHE